MSDSTPDKSDTPKDRNPARYVDPDLFYECVHCGLCTSTCPTYTESGDENDGPRGRIYLMRAVRENRLPAGRSVKQHLELCLDCRSCETSCPSGVQYARLIEPFRLALDEDDKRLLARFDWFRETVLFRLFPYPNRIRLALAPIRIAQRLGIYNWAERLGLFKLVPGRLGQMVTLVNEPVKPGPKLPEFPARRGTPQGKGGILRGLRGRRHVPPYSLGHAASLAAERLRRIRAAGDRDVAARSTTMPAAPRVPGKWPTPTWRPSIWRTSTR